MQPRMSSHKNMGSHLITGKMLSFDLFLIHFDPKLSIIVAAGTSSQGVGAVISYMFPDSSEKVIMHAAHKLILVEKYAQLKKEALALVFAVGKFHKMV
ncbi:unnamed protein product [Dicrocoelium dendriticum]|nr:unnamed protein product [Dicrocoelium dendriticum]